MTGAEEEEECRCAREGEGAALDGHLGPREFSVRGRWSQGGRCMAGVECKRGNKFAEPAIPEYWS